MKFFLTEDALIMAIGEEGDIDGDQSELIQEGWKLLTTEELTELRKPTVEQLEEATKQAIAQQLATLTVTTYNGNVFDATLEARQNMADAIIASATLGSTTTTWRMADNSEVLITLDELKEAHALSIQEYARIKGIGV